MFDLNWFFASSPGELTILGLVVLLASVVRGCLGFGLSALIVASTSFWLPPVAVVGMVVLLEIMASLSMFKSIRSSVDSSILVPMTLGTLPTSLLGVWLLTVLPLWAIQLLISGYLGAIALAGLLGYEYRGRLDRWGFVGVGLFSGFFNGLAGLGGMSIAMFLVAVQRPMAEVRATLIVFFIFGELIFLVGAWINEVYTVKVVATATLALIPMWLGLWLGSHLFSRFSEQMLKRLVHTALVLLAVLGIVKTALG